MGQLEALAAPYASGGSWEGLVESAQAGDVAAFEALYRGHVGRVYALCLRMTAEVSAAEDLTQEAFVRAWRKLGSFRGDSAFSTWLHRVAVNVVLGHRRSRMRRAARMEALKTEPGRAPSSSPALRMDLEAAIASLPDGAREVFVLHEVEGYRHDEIAELAGIATGTSKAHLHRARTLLKERLTS